MTWRVLGILMGAMGVLAGAGAAPAQEPPAPPDRLEKRVPAQPPPREPPAKSPESPRQSPATRPKPEDKPRAQTEADATAEDPHALRDQVSRGMEESQTRLGSRDLGERTRSVQAEVVRNIDKLLKLLDKPPPPAPPSSSNSSPSPPNPESRNGPPPPSGGSSGESSGTRDTPQPRRDSSAARDRGQPQPRGAQPQGEPSQPRASGDKSQAEGDKLAKDRQARRERRQQRQALARTGANRRDEASRPGDDPRDPRPEMTGAGQPPESGPPTPRGSPEKMADVVKDIWGHLPETMRQEVDHYYREQFMPRYRDLLQEYYSRLAERDRARRPEP